MSCLRTIGRLVSEFARLILFVAIIVFLLSSLLLLAFTYQTRRDFVYARVDDINNGLTVLVGLSIYLIVLAIIGIFAAFFSSKGTIKLVAFMLTLNVIIGVVVLNTSYPKFESAHAELEKNFKEFLTIYDWNHQNQKEEIRNATQAWDNLQTDSHCCGLKSPDDWAQYRPKTIGENFLPVSCCQGAEVEKGVDYCDTRKQKFWTNGCAAEMEGAVVAILYMLVGLVCFSFVLGVLCLLVICCQPNTLHFEGY